LQAPVGKNFAIEEGQQAMQGMQKAGDSAQRIAMDMQSQANQLRVDDALNKAKEASLRLTFDKDVGYTNQKGIAALERQSGKPLADEYGDELKGHITKIGEGLGNDVQRQLFNARANDLMTSFRGNAIQHESGEFKTYALSVREGTVANRMQEIGLNYNNPAVIDEAITSIQAATYDMAKMQGKSAEWAEAQTRKMTSNAHKVALGAALEKNDVAYADAYLKKYSKQMDADDLLRARGLITKEMDTRVGSSVAFETIGMAAPRISTSDAERAFNVAVGTESNGKQFDKAGNPLTSPKGAIGIAQVMPTTAPEAAKLAGLPWDEQRYKTDAVYNKALGMAYFQKQLQDNEGDVNKAWAAYNGGPGALQQAVKKAEQSVRLNASDPSVPVRQWLDFMPKETRDYVAKNSKEFAAGQGANERITFAEIDNQLRADPRLANNPERYKIARVEAERVFNEQEKARKMRDEDSVANAMRAVIGNGGRYSDLPASIRSQIPPKEVDNVIGFAQKIAKGDDTTSPGLYNKLTADTAYLTGLSDSEFFKLRKELSETDFKHFSNERAKLQGKGPESKGPGELNTQAINSTLDDRLRMLKIDPTPKDGSDDSARVGAMRKFVNEYFVTAQREAGKKFTDAEVVAHLDTLFAKNAKISGVFSDSSGPIMNMRAGDIPSAEKTKIKEAFKRSGVDSPSDAQILDIYWKRQLARK
jgi:soluble lytic murein transglycosylase